MFGVSVEFKVDGEETTEYDPRTFYSGRLEGKCKGQIVILSGVAMVTHGLFVCLFFACLFVCA